MREKPYCSGVTQEKLESMQGEYRKELCGRIDKLLIVFSEYGENCRAWESAWADFTYAVTTLFDGNDPKVMRIVMEEVITLLKAANSSHYPESIISKLEVLLEQDSAWIDEDTLSVESMEDAELSDREDYNIPGQGVLQPYTLFGGRNSTVDLTPEHVRGAKRHLDCLGTKRRDGGDGYTYITPDKNEGDISEEKKTISPEGKKRRVESDWSYPYCSWNWSSNGTPVVTPEIKTIRNQEAEEEGQDKDDREIPLLVFPAN